MNDSIALKKLNRRAESIACLQQILRLQPNHSEAQFNLADEYTQQGDLPQAIALYQNILDKIAPTRIVPNVHHENAPLHSEMLEQHIGYTKAFPNLLFMSHYLSPQQPEKLAQLAKHYGTQLANSLHYPPPPRPQKQPEKLHIGIVSADLRDHPVGYFLSSLLKSHAAQRFTWSAYCNNPTPELDTLAQQIHPQFRHWHHIKHWLDARVIEQIRSDGINILLDLSGLTHGHRIGIFAAQAAPVQINWLGYFGTTGLPTMQAIIADPYCVPPSESHWFSEKVYRLPHTRLCMDEPHEACAVSPLPALHNGYITFGTFQNVNKINDDVLSTWATIAQKLPDAHWRFQSMSKQPENHLQTRLQAFGFDASKVHFTAATSMPDYFAAHQHIDLILDTFPYPGGTTTCQALYMGVPTISLTQAGMLARQGEQLLSAVGLREFVCTSTEDYVAKALFWANPSRLRTLNALRLGLREHVRHTPLFDYQRFGADWADVVQQIWYDTCSVSTPT